MVLDAQASSLASSSLPVDLSCCRCRSLRSSVPSQRATWVAPFVVLPLALDVPSLVPCLVICLVST